MSRIEGLEWRNKNSLRRYPFTDGSSLFFDGGALPPCWILDARIYPRGLYGAAEPCRVSGLSRLPGSVALTVTAGPSVLGTATAVFGSSDDLISITDGVVSTGCLVVDPACMAVLEAIDEGDYVLPPGTADFLPSCIEPLPERQVASLGGAAGDVLISCGEGVSIARLDSSTLRVDITGDPHSTRLGCVEGAQQEGNQALDLAATFLERLTVLHYVKNPAGELSGPFASRLEPRSDGSVALVLKTPVTYYEGADPVQVRESRPAFRITAEGSTLTFSMAGGS